MKTAISIPDEVFNAAESLAKQLGVSRSELFTRALEAYIHTHEHDKVREALDLVYTEESSNLDPSLAQVQWASLPREDW
jgi:metal-responsive CopG/Arc/MetJ family transcriptional regulator